MATLNLGRVRMHFRGDFDDLNGQTMLFYDAVYFRGSLYVKLTDTPQVANTAEVGGNQPSRDDANWMLITSGIEYIGEWQASTLYWKNQIVKMETSSWIALQEVPANRNNPEAEYLAGTGYWEPLAEGIGKYVQGYIGGIELSPNTFVIWEGNLQISNTTVLAGENPTTNPEKFDVAASGFNPEGAWMPATFYEYRDVAVFHGNSYVVVNTSGTTIQPINEATGVLEADWKLLTNGIQYVGALNELAGIGYYPGDAVAYDGRIWAVQTRAFLGETPDTHPAKFTEMLTATSSSALKISDLSDTNVTGAVDGAILQFNSGVWTATNVVDTSVGTLTLTGGTF